MTTIVQLQSNIQYWNDMLDRHTPVLRSCWNTLISIGTPAFDIADEPRPRLAMIIYASHAHTSVANLISGALLCLEGKQFLASDVLARHAMEQMVELMYVVDDSEQGRMRGLLDDYLYRSRERAQLWLTSAKTSHDAQDIANAKARLDLMGRVMGLESRDKPDWPAMATRSEDVGLAAQYHYLFAATPDVQAMVCEDAYQLISTEALARFQGDVPTQTWRAERDASSTFVLAYALWFYCYMLGARALAVGESNVAATVSTVSGQLSELIEEHERASADSRKGEPAGLAQRVKMWLDKLGR